MASYVDEVKEDMMSYRRIVIIKDWKGVLGSLGVSLVGGILLFWWELNYHPTNDQQWMVPLGLILFATPLMICFSVFISDLCRDDVPAQNLSPQNSMEIPFRDPER